jgi:hypothetical protein
MGSHKSVSSLESDVLARRITAKPHNRQGAAKKRVAAATAAARTVSDDFSAAIRVISGKWP